MSKKNFIIGKIYPFRFIKKIELDGEFYVFEDIYGERYLISSYYYKNYNFKTQQEVLCRILRIDCSGKVSFEPEHPYYKTGKIYDFKFKEQIIITEENAHKFSRKSKTPKKYGLIIVDIYGNEHLVEANKKQKPKNSYSGKISCKIISITKGNFELQIVENNKENFFQKIFHSFIGV